AMRKVSKERTPDGFYRIFLNNEPIFSMGPLDQGWWPDGLYTAPSDEALLYDIQKTKDLGFNSIRKHTKVEPDRFYYHCDRVGIMVWQDMPSGDIPGSPWNEGRFAFLDNDPRQRPSESMAQYYADWEGIMDQLYSHPSIIMWVPFNEGWGQSNTVEVTEWTKKKDPSRLVNPASGGNLFRTGDVLDIHNYPAPIIRGYDSEYINVLGEYGGIGLPVEGHLWKESDDKNKNWGYVTLEGIESVTRKYVEFAQILLGQVYEGTSAAIYTQTTDVETEVNGLMTYDRKVLKVDEKRVAKANKALCQSLGYGMKVHEITARADKFSSVKGKDAEFVTLTNNNGTVINISSYGARVVDWVVADKNGEPRNIVWGFSSIEEFCTPGTKYAGPVVGRYGNRLAKGQFSIDGTAYQVDKNENGNHLHGGIGGFESIVWETEKFSDENGNDAVRFTYDSPDGDQGYPGELKVSVVFTLNSDNELVLDYEAVPVDKPTVCNLTLHPFFNLHGRGLGLASTHQVTFNADRFTPVDAELIPTGEIKPIKELISDMTKLPTLDNNMVLKENNGEGLNLAVTVTEPSTGITLEILTDQPAVQCYNAEPAHGIVLEPQNFPDAPNHENFPNSVYRPGEKYTQTSVYRVTVK
ncbi:MAG: hypothetical protein HUJ93_03300, partial [Bacteroidales bacterium]|nr:hypothetical protein [Bacteroidales bacterium]